MRQYPGGVLRARLWLQSRERGMRERGFCTHKGDTETAGSSQLGRNERTKDFSGRRGKIFINIKKGSRTAREIPRVCVLVRGACAKSRTVRATRDKC